MPDIEEAWEPFSSLNRRMGKDRARAAARGLALAVLDEAASDLDDATLYEWLRQRIEALG